VGGGGGPGEGGVLILVLLCGALFCEMLSQAKTDLLLQNNAENQPSVLNVYEREG
jgi:hypothetical protein